MPYSSLEHAAYLLLTGAPLVFGPSGLPCSFLSPTRDGLGCIVEARDGVVYGGTWDKLRTPTPDVLYGSLEAAFQLGLVL